MTGIVSCDSKPMVLKARLTFRRIVPGKCCKRRYLSARWYYGKLQLPHRLCEYSP